MPFRTQPQNRSTLLTGRARRKALRRVALVGGALLAFAAAYQTAASAGLQSALDAAGGAQLNLQRIEAATAAIDVPAPVQGGRPVRVIRIWDTPKE